MDADEKISRIMAIREKLGCSVQEAKRIINREELLDAIGAASSIDDIKWILLRIV